MKAVIYARYSSDNQREESIEGQIRECTAFAEKNDITVLKHYIDRAYSARTDHRPAFQEMIKDSDKHLFDMVIVWKLDRFSRDRFRVDSALDCQRRECVSEIMKSDVLLNSGFFEQLLVNPSDAIRTIHPACFGRWE